LTSISKNSNIHSTVVIEGNVSIASDVSIGPFCHIVGPVTIGEYTRISSHCVIKGPVIIGAKNRINPHCIFGTEPESRGQVAKGMIQIGNNNIFTEKTVITHGTSSKGTTIGNENYFLGNVHVSHDCNLGNQITAAHNVVFAGETNVQDGATIGIGAAIHQNSTIGAYSMIGMNSTITKDVPPFTMVFGNPAKIRKWNTYQMNKLGMTKIPSGEIYEKYHTKFIEVSRREILDISSMIDSK
jgi:UDP-N-acetylglucosamine acyltransferase